MDEISKGFLPGHRYRIVSMDESGSGLGEKLQARGIDVIHYMCHMDKFAQVCDPDFVSHHLVPVFAGIADGLARGESVFIHCRLGVNRSLATAMLFIVIAAGLDPDTAAQLAEAAQSDNVAVSIMDRAFVQRAEQNWPNLVAQAVDASDDSSPAESPLT